VKNEKVPLSRGDQRVCLTILINEPRAIMQNVRIHERKKLENLSGSSASVESLRMINSFFRRLVIPFLALRAVDFAGSLFKILIKASGVESELSFFVCAALALALAEKAESATEIDCPKPVYQFGIWSPDQAVNLDDPIAISLHLHTRKATVSRLLNFLRAMNYAAR
jgi:hypothetical protein